MVDPFIEGSWEGEFIEVTHQISLWLRLSSEICIRLSKELFRPTIYQIEAFPFDLDNQVFEQACLNLTVERMIKSYGLQTNRAVFSAIHAYETVLGLIYILMRDIWGALAIQSSQETTVGYVDQIIRSTIPDPPGYGIGYFCLRLVQGVKMNPFLFNQIDGARSIQPTLPFSKEEYRIIRSINPSDDLIRLALLLVHELSTAQRLSKVDLNMQSFPDAFWYTLLKRGFLDLTLFRECLLQTTKSFQMFSCQKCTATIGLWISSNHEIPSSLTDSVYHPATASKLRLQVVQPHLIPMIKKCPTITIIPIFPGPNFPHQIKCLSPSSSESSDPGSDHPLAISTSLDQLSSLSNQPPLSDPLSEPSSKPTSEPLSDLKSDSLEIELKDDSTDHIIYCQERFDDLFGGL